MHFPTISEPASASLQVRDEIIENVEATYKETDLFKMFQTGDLANMDALPAEQAAKLPTVRALRDAIYSPEFRAFISHVTGWWVDRWLGAGVRSGNVAWRRPHSRLPSTQAATALGYTRARTRPRHPRHLCPPGCGELSDQTDCACNVHACGGHLLCHDDVIGNRRVSYIIYLTDPEQVGVVHVDGWRSGCGLGDVMCILRCFLPGVDMFPCAGAVSLRFWHPWRDAPVDRFPTPFPPLPFKQPWTAEDGGALELYPQGKGACAGGRGG